MIRNGALLCLFARVTSDSRTMLPMRYQAPVPGAFWVAAVSTTAASIVAVLL